MIITQYRYTTSAFILAFGWVWIWVYLVFYVLEKILSLPIAVTGICLALASLIGYVTIHYIPPKLGEALGLLGWILIPLSLFLPLWLE